MAAAAVGGGWYAGTQSRERFLREARIVARLTHPNIVPIFDFGVHDDAPFLVMEHLGGQSLDVLIQQGRTDPLSVKLKAMIEVCRALDHAHGNSVIHRDVKPSNIQLDPAGAKLLDFGIARLESGHTLTETGMMIGTPGYMAPEVIRGQAPDVRSDLFAVGATLFEWLTYRKCFAGERLEAVIANIVHADPPDLADVMPDCPRLLRHVVNRCLAKSPNSRFDTAAELGAALSDVDLASKASGTTLIVRAAPVASSRRFGRWAAGALVVLTCGGIVSLLSTSSNVGQGSPSLEGPGSKIEVDSGTETQARPTIEPPPQSDELRRPQSEIPRSQPAVLPPVLAAEDLTAETAASSITEVTTSEGAEPVAVIAERVAIGTEMPVRILTSLRSDRVRVGTDFDAVLTDPVLFTSGREAFPIETPVRGRVQSVQPGAPGRLPAMELLLTSALVGDTQIPVRTGIYRVAPPLPPGDVSIKTLLIGASVGAAVGGLVDGGRGSGAGAALGAALVQSGVARHDEYVFGDRITFKLASSIVLDSK